jgi:AcrR family transcriptional regulator
LKREAVLLTAARFFNTRGFHATSLDDVALALNVTKPTIYHYFASKDEVLFECVRRGLESIREATAKAAAEGGSGHRRLEALLLDYARVMTMEFGICVARTQDNELSAASRKRFRALKREIDTIVREVIEQGVADGSLATKNPRLATFTLTGALNWIAHWYEPKGSLSADEVARGAVATLLNGLLPNGRN